MSTVSYDDAETAMLILEELTGIAMSEGGDTNPILNCRSQMGIAEERNIILTHSAPALNAAYNENGDLTNCCFDMEIIETVLEQIAKHEDGLSASKCIWHDAYQHAYLIHEKGLSQKNAEKKINGVPMVESVELDALKVGY